MTGFHEIRFPDNIAYGATGGPEFATTVVVTGAGHECQSALNIEPLSASNFDPLFRHLMPALSFRI